MNAKGKIQFNTVITARPLDIVALDWKEKRLDDEDDTSFLKDPGWHGVYAFEGCHDANAAGGVVYIGRTSRGGSRVEESLARVWRETSDGRMRLYSDVWNVTVRWAEAPEACVENVETLLIAAHSPAFNSALVRRPIPETLTGLLVFNAGRKGRLIPVVSGLYLRDQEWAENTKP